MEEAIKLKGGSRIVFTMETDDKVTQAVFSPDGDYISHDLDIDEFYELVAVVEKIHLEWKMAGLFGNNHRPVERGGNDGD